MITNVTIEKVKGIGYKSFDLEIKENKYNLLVALNGFGKSSFFAAFDSLRATKMELKNANVPIGGDNVSCKLSITDNGETLTADESTHKTVEKLKYAESCGVSVNDIFYLLGILYNDVEHTWSNGIDKPAIYKLENLVVRKIISDIFDFKGDSIKIDSIH